MSPKTDDSINTATIFGEIKRTIVTKDFKGGNVKNVFGDIELDFTGADINGTAVLNISQLFGQVTIAVPVDWQVEADVTHILSEMEDDRSYLIRKQRSNKVLTLTGLSVFAAVEIVNDLEN
ncbi:LiaF domain-containing protein [Mucilaginibacter sp. OK283]|uniref:LiaF domain-containing protein n=1 Tax=Mucilaginibacter sp. OK283 TaxID=1881049 RepID=UPI0015A5BF4A|nr:LiaF domain-containing protein [Mucilaginibacter sp. OK283]